MDQGCLLPAQGTAAAVVWERKPRKGSQGGSSIGEVLKGRIKKAGRRRGRGTHYAKLNVE